MNGLIYAISKCIPDKIYLQLLYFKYFHRLIDFKNPKTFNEKLQWLKLNDRNPEYTKLVDKYAVKQHIADTIGSEYVIPTLGVWERAEDIDFDRLPNRFVLKCTHDSGSVVICRDKENFDRNAAIEKLKKGLRRNGYWYGREWPYKNVPPKVIAEEFVEDSNGELNDYKFFCFDGLVDCVMVVADRQKNNAKFYYMSRDWKVLPYGRLTRSLPSDFTLPKPERLDEMFQIAEKLSKGFPHVRLDLYNVDGQIFFGEYTLYSQSGLEDGFDYASNKHLGDQLVLPPKNISN